MALGSPDKIQSEVLLDLIYDEEEDEEFETTDEYVNVVENLKNETFLLSSLERERYQNYNIGILSIVNKWMVRLQAERYKLFYSHSLAP